MIFVEKPRQHIVRTKRVVADKGGSTKDLPGECRLFQQQPADPVHPELIERFDPTGPVRLSVAFRMAPCDS